MILLVDKFLILKTAEIYKNPGFFESCPLFSVRRGGEWNLQKGGEKLRRRLPQNPEKWQPRQDSNLD